MAKPILENGYRWWTDEDKQYLRQHYYDTDSNELVNQLGRSWQAILTQAQRMKLHRSRDEHSRIRSPINHGFFKSWSQDMAYILGFIMADGCIKYHNAGWTLYIKVNQQDEPVLDWILQTAQSSHRIYKAARNCVGIAIGSKSIYRDLECLGVVERKSLTLQWPEIPAPYLHHFARGYFDGDGCFWIARGNRRSSHDYTALGVKILGTASFLDGLHACISDAIKMELPPLRIHRNGITRELILRGEKAVAFGRWMYGDASFSLQRKQNIYLQFV